MPEYRGPDSGQIHALSTLSHTSVAIPSPIREPRTLTLHCVLPAVQLCYIEMSANIMQNSANYFSPIRPVNKMTRRPVLTGTVPFFDLLSLCPEIFRWDASLSRFVENWNLISIFVSLIFWIIIHRPIETRLCQNSYLKFLCPNFKANGAYYWWRRKFVTSNNQQDNAATYYPAWIFPSRVIILPYVYNK